MTAMSDIPNTNETPTRWEVFKFHVVGWFACLVTGNLWKYDVLLAQAKLETGHYTSRQFRVGRNAFGMMTPEPFAQGSMEGADGQMARYSSWWACWRGRLAWDDRRGIRKTYNTLREYATAVQQAGYNPDPRYVDRWMDVYQDTASWLTKLVNAPVDGGSFFQRVKIFIFLIGLLTLIVLVLWVIFKVKRWKRSSAAR